MSNTVLVVEDDPTTAELVRLYLARDGHAVLTAKDGVEGLRLAREKAPDLVVLDIMLPKMDGLQVCRSLRADSDVPIIMLTARVEEEDRLAGLDLGADDYITKPFSPRELAARVRAVLRRSSKDALEQGPKKLSYNGIQVDMGRRTAAVDGEPLSLTPTEFRLLGLFMKAPGYVFSRDVIIERVFGYEFEGFDRSVDTHVSNLRRKLEGKSGKKRYIHTVYGAGYKLGDE
jgi:DNA-binding response OmpR family regulator